MFGHLKTIKVWVALLTVIPLIKINPFSSKEQGELSEFEYVAVFPEVRKIPGDKMAQMNATIIFWSKIVSK
jgi:hypothetical protein